MEYVGHTHLRAILKGKLHSPFGAQLQVDYVRCGTTRIVPWPTTVQSIPHLTLAANVKYSTSLAHCCTLWSFIVKHKEVTFVEAPKQITADTF